MLRPPQVVRSQSQMRLNRGLGSLHIAVDRLGEQRGRGQRGSPHSRFLQEVHLHPSHLQESAQVQEPPREGDATGRDLGWKLWVGQGRKGGGGVPVSVLWGIAMPTLHEVQNEK